jgi:hypothetical protein
LESKEIKGRVTYPLVSNEVKPIAKLPESQRFSIKKELEPVTAAMLDDQDQEIKFLQSHHKVFCPFLFYVIFCYLLLVLILFLVH